MPTTNPATSTAEAVPGVGAPETAAVWIDDGHAMVARMDADGRIRISRVERGVDPELTYLAAVVHAIGDRRHVAILGPVPSGWRWSASTSRSSSARIGSSTSSRRARSASSTSSSGWRGSRAEARPQRYDDERVDDVRP
jgi:hypothetical protein